MTRAPAAADALRALETDRRLDHALRTDRPLAPGAADAGLAVRVAITARDAVGVLPGIGGLVVHEIP
ncbi:hypothetical protein GCM10010233_20100 [Streptomyces pseudogriseolus]|nr:hypothetical protein GCM10010233_20100 [Streptomyces gancidicus]